MFKFENFNTTAQASKGVDHHVTHPYLGHPLYVGEGADDNGKLVDPKKDHAATIWTIRAYSAPEVKALIEAHQREVMENGETEEAALKHEDDMIDTLLIGWQNVPFGEGMAELTRANKIAVLSQDGNLKAQLIKVAKDRQALFKAASTN